MVLFGKVSYAPTCAGTINSRLTSKPLRSNGGGFTVNILACNATAVSKFAAFAGVASADYQAEPSGGCNGVTVFATEPCDIGLPG